MRENRMLIVLLILTLAGTAWSIWAYAHPPKCAQPPVERPEPTPVDVQWDEQTDSVEDKRRMLDKIFETHRQTDDDVDPATVVADRR